VRLFARAFSSHLNHIGAPNFGFETKPPTKEKAALVQKLKLGLSSSGL
jgi:hypothetical protein